VQRALVCTAKGAAGTRRRRANRRRRDEQMEQTGCRRSVASRMANGRKWSKGVARATTGPTGTRGSVDVMELLWPVEASVASHSAARTEARYLR
jgi:hypothetical protein